MRPYDERAYSRYVYWRGSCYVDVSVANGWVRMETTAVPQSFINRYGLDMEYDDDDEEGPAYYRLNKLIEDVNDGNYYAGVFLVSQVMSDNLSVPGSRGAWCPTEESAYEDARLYLNVKALTDVIGDLLITDDEDIILPISYNYKLCYLTKPPGRRSSDYYARWRDVNSTQVTARAYTEYDRDARLLQARE